MLNSYATHGVVYGFFVCIMKFAILKYMNNSRNERLAYQEFFTLVDHPDFRHLDLVEDLRTIRDNQEKKSTFLKELGILF
jgi:hypothetical protein